jgi:hypothetical protein
VDGENGGVRVRWIVLLNVIMGTQRPEIMEINIYVVVVRERVEWNVNGIYNEKSISIRIISNAHTSCL